MAANDPHLDAIRPPATGASVAYDAAAVATDLIHADEAAALPVSFGVFKPVGHVMMGLPTQARVDALVLALQGAGWPDAGVRQFSPRESVQEMRTMVDSAGPLAGFGYEITLLKRYLALAEQGYRWLLVQADSTEQATAAAALASASGATLAVYYRRFTVEELIP